jgi:hypothetical protein
MADRKTEAGTSAQSSITDNMNTDTENKPESPTPSDQSNYISGPRLFAVTGAVTLVVFLMLLDMSIISTVCPPLPLSRVVSSSSPGVPPHRAVVSNPASSALGYSQNYHRVSLTRGHRVVWFVL